MFWSSVHEAKRVDDCSGEISVLPTMRSRSGKRLQIHYMGESRDGLHRQRRILAKSVLDSPQRQRGGSSTNLKIVREVSD